MNNVKYLREVAQSCIVDLNQIGIYPNITADKFTINNRLKSTWGRCWTHYKNNKTEWWFNIEISGRLMEENVPLDSLKNTVYHELLHACDECVNEHHGGKWAEYAKLVSRRYGINIQRCTSHTEKEVEDIRKAYKWKCSACEKTFTKMAYRAPKWYKHPQGYIHTGCPCGKGRVLSEYYGFKEPKIGTLIYA